MFCRLDCHEEIVICWALISPHSDGLCVRSLVGAPIPFTKERNTYITLHLFILTYYTLLEKSLDRGGITPGLDIGHRKVIQCYC